MDDTSLTSILAWALVLVAGLGLPGAVAFGIAIGREREKHN